MRTAKELRGSALGTVNESWIELVQDDARANLLKRMKALEDENARLRRDLMDPPADTEALTQYRVALERCVDDLQACMVAIQVKDEWSRSRVLKSACVAIVLATPLIEKGRK